MSLPLAIGIAGSVALFMAFAVAKVVQVRRQPVAVGTSNLVGTPGVVRRGGLVAVKGELWQAESADGEPLDDRRHSRRGGRQERPAAPSFATPTATPETT